MLKKIKEFLFPIIIAIIAVFLCLWYVSLAPAHENEIWRDSKGSGIIVYQEPCGLGYSVYTRPDGSIEASLMANHFHLLRHTYGITNCDQLFNYLAVRIRHEIVGPGPIMTYNHPADQPDKEGN